MFSDTYTIRRAIDTVFTTKLSDTDSYLTLFGPIYLYSMTPNFLKESKKMYYDMVKERIIIVLSDINERLSEVFLKNGVAHEKEQIDSFADFIIGNCLFDQSLNSSKGAVRTLSKIKGLITTPIQGISKVAFVTLQAKAFRAATIEYFQSICEKQGAEQAKELSYNKYQETYREVLRDLICW